MDQICLNLQERSAAFLNTFERKRRLFPSLLKFYFWFRIKHFCHLHILPFQSPAKECARNRALNRIMMHSRLEFLNSLVFVVKHLSCSCKHLKRVIENFNDSAGKEITMYDCCSSNRVLKLKEEIKQKLLLPTHEIYRKLVNCSVDYNTIH